MRSSTSFWSSGSCADAAGAGAGAAGASTGVDGVALRDRQTAIARCEKVVGWSIRLVATYGMLCPHTTPLETLC